MFPPAALFQACPAGAGSKVPGRIGVLGCFGAGFVLMWHGKLFLLCMFPYFPLSVRFPIVLSIWQSLQKATGHGSYKGLSFHLISLPVTYYPSLSKFNSFFGAHFSFLYVPFANLESLKLYFVQVFYLYFMFFSQCFLLIYLSLWWLFGDMTVWYSIFSLLLKVVDWSSAFFHLSR